MVQIVGKEVATTVHDLGPRRAEAGGMTRAPAFVRRSVGEQIFLQLDGKEKLAAFAMARGDTTSNFFEATLRMCFVKSTLTFWRRLAEQVPSVETTEEAVGVLPQAARREADGWRDLRGGCRELAAEFETRRARETPAMFPPNTRK
ncbi:hypothetical protein NHJ13734_001648 [Beauveria thailandica]